MSFEKQNTIINNDTGKITRRQFLKNTGLIVGGAAFSQMALAAACNTAATTMATGGSITSPPNTVTSPTGTTGGSAIVPTPTTPNITGDVYIAPSERPPLTITPGCTTYVAFDRLYSVEHIWVKELGNRRAVMGITDKLQALMDGVTRLALPGGGTTIRGGTSFGESEGFKMAVDLITPVSIKVIQTNHDLLGNMALLNTDPFLNGWMMYVELTQPEELNEMISPQEYMMLQAK